MKTRFAGLIIAISISVAGLNALAQETESHTSGATRHLKDGEAAARSGDWLRAKTEFNRAVELDPKNVIAFYDLGVTLAHQNNLLEASQAERQALMLDSHYVPAYVELGSILYKLHDYSLAAQVCKMALRYDPHNVGATNNLSAINAALKAVPAVTATESRIVGAATEVKRPAPNTVPAAAIEKIVEKSVATASSTGGITFITPPEAVAATKTTAMSSVSSVLPVYSTAMPVVSSAPANVTAVVVSPTDAEPSKVAVQAPVTVPIKTVMQSAQTGASESVSREPFETAAQTSLQIEAAKRAEARAIAKAAANARRAQGCVAAGQAAYKKGDLELAQKKFEEAIALDDKSAVAHANLGVVFGAEGQFEKEIECEKRAIELDNKNAFALTSLGWAEAKMLHWDQALDAYQRALAIAPTLQEAEMGQALALFHSGREEAGIAAMRVIKDRSEPQVEPLIALGTMFQQQGRLREAEIELQAAVSMSPEDLAARQQLANLLLAKGDGQRSLVLFKSIVADAPSNAGAHVGLSMAFELNGDDRQAESEAKKALELNPKLQVAQNCLERLEQKRTVKQ